MFTPAASVNRKGTFGFKQVKDIQKPMGLKTLKIGNPNDEKEKRTQIIERDSEDSSEEDSSIEGHEDAVKQDEDDIYKQQTAMTPTTKSRNMLPEADALLA